MSFYYDLYPPFEPSITANIHHNSRPLFLIIGALFSLSSHPPHLLCFPCFIHRNFIRRFFIHRISRSYQRFLASRIIHGILIGKDLAVSDRYPI